MLFNSIEFAIFFPAVVLIYFLLPHRFRWILLLTASYYFYACWKAEYLVLIVFSTLVDYFAGLRMAACETKKQRTPYLILSLFSNLGLLFAFKYLDFFGASVQTIIDQVNIFYDVPTFDLLLPVGISFYTFQTLSYTIEVYKGTQEPERHLGIFALYVTFFPQLVAGPIERSQTLLPQFHKRMAFSYDRLSSGTKLIIWGLFKKILIGDGMGVFVDSVYNNPYGHDSASLLIASICFSFQIYGDFSGYTDIARGSARILGFDLMENFRQPYLSKSISEFWQRWHISLSTWFRDYVYIPMGGNRVVKWRWYYNLFITFLVSGLWHGANWTFVVWGALHGLYLIGAILTGPYREAIKNAIGLTKFPKLHDWVQIATVYVLVLVGWIFFRASNVTDAFYIIGQIFDLTNYSSGLSLLSKTQVSPFYFLIGMGLLIGFLIVDYLGRKQDFVDYLNSLKIGWRWSVMYLLLFALVFLAPKASGTFIYFQF